MSSLISNKEYVRVKSSLSCNFLTSLLFLDDFPKKGKMSSENLACEYGLQDKEEEDRERKSVKKRTTHLLRSQPDK